MWYFLVKQVALDIAQHRDLQRRAANAEVELFNEPYENWYVFSVEKNSYPAFMNHLDREGIAYDLMINRPTRNEILAAMR
jgi:hypothetical protein